MTFSPYLAAIRLLAFLAVTGVLVVPYLLLFPLGTRVRRVFSGAWFRAGVSLTGLRLRTEGDMPAGCGALYAVNHVSYLDIPVLGALLDAEFVAKVEVRGWPLFGFLARIALTQFVSRQAMQAPKERLAIANRLASGRSIILFPEGSSSDGEGVLPFRSGLLSAALADDELNIPVQPVSIVYGPAAKNARALSRDHRDLYAWYGDMDLSPHLWRVFGANEKIDVKVIFHAPQPSSAFANRKALALWAEEEVRDGIAQGLGAMFVSELPASASSKSETTAAS